MIDTQDQALVAAFESTRARTLGLVETLSAEDACVQSMPQASPTKWHLAHTTWFFETFVLEPYEKDFRPFAPAFRVLFNSYYQGIGAQHPRGQRGLLTRPSLQEVLRYRSDVDNRVIALLNGGRLDARVVTLLTLGLQHEQQHQELILPDLLQLFSCNPLAPAYLNTAPAPKGHVVDRSIREEATTWHALAGGLVQIGHDGIGFCFDNELPQHPTYVAPCDVATHLVTNGQYLRFVQDGGYTEPHHWLAEGWDWRTTENRNHPLYWHKTAHSEGWTAFGLAGQQALDLQAPVMHISFYEADAFARWAGARLPTEAEWEVAAKSLDASDAPALQQLWDQAWQWTQSSYAPYPGFRAAEDAVGEYNEKFMVNQYVLRGGWRATGIRRTTKRTARTHGCHKPDAAMAASNWVTCVL